MADSADPEQLASDLDLHCLQNRVYPGSAGQGLRKITKTICKQWRPGSYAAYCTHYENTPIQICWKFHHQKMKIFR